jgi:hypothetical protein
MRRIDEEMISEDIIAYEYLDWSYVSCGAYDSDAKYTQDL